MNMHNVCVLGTSHLLQGNGGGGGYKKGGAEVRFYPRIKNKEKVDYPLSII